MSRQLTIIRPDDWHVHLREGAMLRAVLPYHASLFGRFVAMPNLKIPLTTRAHARAYAGEIAAALPKHCQAQGLIPCYLSEETSAEELIAGHCAGDFFGAKLYPLGATTHSQAGVRDVRKLYPLFEAMQEHGVPLLIHGESVAEDVDIYDREQVFVERTLSDLVRQFPELTMTMEHLTTAVAVDFIAEQRQCSRLAGSITLHHLLLCRNDMLDEGLRPDYFCYPLVKTAADRAALRRAATSGNAAYFLGTDSAPHFEAQKHCATARAGIFTAPVSLGGYAAVFEAENALPQLEGFASRFGAQHYGLPLNVEHILLEKLSESLESPPSSLAVGSDAIRIFDAPSGWRVV